jgi:hypothetical protein
LRFGLNRRQVVVTHRSCQKTRESQFDSGNWPRVVGPGKGQVVRCARTLGRSRRRMKTLPAMADIRTTPCAIPCFASWLPCSSASSRRCVAVRRLRLRAARAIEAQRQLRRWTRVAAAVQLIRPRIELRITQRTSPVTTSSQTPATANPALRAKALPAAREAAPRPGFRCSSWSGTPLQPLRLQSHGRRMLRSPKLRHARRAGPMAPRI